MSAPEAVKAGRRSGRSAAPPGNAQHVLALMRAHMRGETRHFMSICLQIAADAARKGHHNVAEQIKAMVTDARDGGAERKQAVVVSEELRGIVHVRTPRFGIERLVLAPDLDRKLHKCLRQHGEEARARLAAHGLSPVSKFLMDGPPGTGKTMTAEAVASALGLPLMTVALDGLITKYMGETGAKIGLLFEAMKKHRAVWFFDEFDAIAARRDADNDVGEARRILNTLLVRLEGDIGSSLVFAATNLPELLDGANFRRFHVRLTYGTPTREMIRPVMEGELPDGFAPSLSRIDWNVVAPAASGLSHAEIASAAMDAAREAVLDAEGEISTELLLAALAERASMAEAS